MLLKRYRKQYGQIETYKPAKEQTQTEEKKAQGKYNVLKVQIPKDHDDHNIYRNKEKPSADEKLFEDITVKINPLFIMRVEISPGVYRALKVEKSDNVRTTAQNFCYHYGLDDAAIDHLCHMITLYKSENQDYNRRSSQGMLVNRKQSWNSKQKIDSMEIVNLNEYEKIEESYAYPEYNYDENMNQSGNEVSNHAEPINKGEDLYMKGMKMLETYKDNQKNIKNQMASKNKLNMTFSPKLCKYTKNSNLKSIFGEERFLDIMMHKKKKRAN